MKPLLTALLLAAVAVPATATASTTPIRESLKGELPIWGFGDVDVDGLTRAQVIHINHLLHSNKSPSQIRGNIGAILGDSLIKNLFNRK